MQDLPKRGIRKVERPYIFFENKTQHAIWECVLKEEIASGFWANVKFDKLPYLSAHSYPFPKRVGVTFVPQLMSFYFDNLEFVRENGYYIAMIMKLVDRFTLEPADVLKLAMYAEGFISVDFHDDNSDYRRVQVHYFTVEEAPEMYRTSFQATVDYFKNKGIDMKDVADALRDEPIKVKAVRKLLIEISEVLKKKVDIADIVQSA